MQIIEIIIGAVSVALALLGVLFELKRDLMMFQQNSYRPERYRRWLSESNDSTSLWRLGGLVILFIALSTLTRPYGALALTDIFAGMLVFNLATARYKKPLVWTSRARRIFIVAVALSLIFAGAAIALFDHSSAFGILYTATITLLGCYCASHIIILTANWLLKPVEKAITQHYINDARNILAQMPGLKIIGITGSYGKTSTKHYLHRILSEQYDTLMTPGSYNTTLGVVRTVRELLKPYNEVFIVEMGAKSPGDIKEICDLVKPTTGIITSVGPQHLESFKTIENVQSTKFELADSLPAEGLAIINDDFEKIADRQVTNCRCLRYGVTAPQADYRACDVTFSAQGTTFEVQSRDGWHLKLHTRLMGEHNVSDLLAAVACAHALSVPDKKIAAAVASIEPVEHRLSVKTTPGGVIILDDAFNSNPVGSKMAMEVLGQMKANRKFVVTPGMIELGSAQYELNFNLGKEIARHADIAIIVGAYNRQALQDGICDSKTFPAENLHIVDSFAEAQKIIASSIKSGDIVLYENDLPDTFK